MDLYVELLPFGGKEINSASHAKEDSTMAISKTSNISKTKAIEAIERLIDQFKEQEAKLSINSEYEYDYKNLYDRATGIITEVFSSENPEKEIETFSKDIGIRPEAIFEFIRKGDKLCGPLVIRVFIEHCITCLEIYKQRVQLWQDDGPVCSSVQQIKELTIDNRFSYSISNITHSNLSGIIQGEHNTVMASLNAAGQPALAQVLDDLTQAVLASQDLPEDKKEEQVKVINQIGKEAAEPKPNKTLLKILVDGLLATLKAVPDVAGAVTAATSLLSQLYLSLSPNA